MNPSLALSIQGHSRFSKSVAAFPARTTLRRWIVAALERDAELVLRLVDASEGRQLNKSFRHKDAATNVLTFSYSKSPEVHADIVVCVPVVRNEARAQHKAFRNHLAHLVVHGVLHAQGWDHDRDRQARAMEAKEIEVLGALGMSDPYAEKADRSRRK
ncbi:MAG: rRNA maturation RNase YbeY [Burkholderiaceae bacterium]